jgi:hypothetical protein
MPTYAFRIYRRDPVTGRNVLWFADSEHGLSDTLRRIESLCRVLSDDTKPVKIVLEVVE